MLFDMKKVGNRLRTLREQRKEKEGGWSQSDLAQKLSEYVANALDGEKGKTTVSQLERGARNITVDLAIAYSGIFGVSLDYIFCRSNDWQPENKEIKALTGLTDNAIKAIMRFGEKEKWALNAFLEHDSGKKVFNEIAYYKYQFQNREERNRQAKEWDEFTSRLPAFIQAPEETKEWGKVDAVDFAKFECSQRFIKVLEDIAEGGDK